MQKGFTLIELLAVIVILAIIALIATPIILGIIKDSKEESRERSIDNIIHTARIYAAKEGLEQNRAVHIKDISNMIDGEKLENGIIYFDNKGEVAFSLDFEEEVYVKSFEGEVEKEDQAYYLMKANDPNPPKNDLIEDNKNEYFLTNQNNEQQSPKITKEQVEKIITVPTNKVPNDVLGSWDVSEKGNGKVMAWYKDEDENGLYEVYIGQTGGVKANPNSSFLFMILFNLQEIDLTYLDTSNVTNMYCMFADSYKLRNINVSNFNTSKVTNMVKIFGVNSGRSMKLEQIIGLENFDTSNVTNMRGMFSNCTNLKEINVSSFNTSKVTNMSLMFSSAQFANSPREENMKLERIIGIENFDTSSVGTVEEAKHENGMYAMFQYCSNLKTLDLRNWNTRNVTDMSYMFLGTNNLKPIYIGENWNTAPTINYMFSGSATKNEDEMCRPTSTHEWCKSIN